MITSFPFLTFNLISYSSCSVVPLVFCPTNYSSGRLLFLLVPLSRDGAYQGYIQIVGIDVIKGKKHL